ncbi:hypothetical protein [Chelativorans sp. M5D2P16]|uniref:hypothetical protein n=1 Tax=Chelativorans sp. M5D2P16 TaxID=3095678 RepID=UPI002ACADA66|nr:hypothetical protein [Chelativorans sp. M5D2P16]MDZ5698801.1 hypothetical protein [Chelativorans sp. M5D2P16]
MEKEIKVSIRRPDFNFKSISKATFIVPAICLNMLAGCAAMPDTTMTSSVSVEAEESAPAPQLKKTVRHKKSAGQPSVKVASARYLGRAPYICTPSGFGRTSSCFLR